jgi:hypothetical protein
MGGGETEEKVKSLEIKLAAIPWSEMSPRSRKKGFG